MFIVFFGLAGVILGYCAEIFHLLPTSIPLINTQITILWLEIYKFSLFNLLIKFKDLGPVCHVFKTMNFLEG